MLVLGVLFIIGNGAVLGLAVWVINRSGAGGITGDGISCGGTTDVVGVCVRFVFIGGGGDDGKVESGTSAQKSGGLQSSEDRTGACGAIGKDASFCKECKGRKGGSSIGVKTGGGGIGGRRLEAEEVTLSEDSLSDRFLSVALKASGGSGFSGSVATGASCTLKRGNNTEGVDKEGG